MTPTDYYRIVYALLVNVWETDKSQFPDDLPGFLSSMQLLSDGGSADPAVLSDWLKLYESNDISSQQAFQNIEEFLDFYLHYPDHGNEWQSLVKILYQEETWVKWQELVSNYQ